MSHNSEKKTANANKDLIRLQRFRQQLSGDRCAWGSLPVEPSIGERRDFLIREKSCGSLGLLGEAEAGSAGKQPRQGIAESKRRSDVGTDLVLLQFQIRPSFAWFFRRLRRAVRAKGTLHLTAPFFRDSIAIVKQLPGSISPFVEFRKHS